MDQHVKARLTAVLDAEGLDALVASTPENLQYVTGFRSIAHALFRGPRALRGVHAPGRGARHPVHRLDRGLGRRHRGRPPRLLRQLLLQLHRRSRAPIGTRVREITSRARGRARRGAARGAGRSRGRWAGGSASTRRACSRPRGSGSASSSRARRSRPPTPTSGPPAWSRARTRSRRLERAALIAEDGIAAILGHAQGRASPSARRRSAFEQEVLRARAPSRSSRWSRSARPGRARRRVRLRDRRSRRATSSASTSAASTRAIARTSRAPLCWARPPRSSGATTTRSATARRRPSRP